MSALAWLNRPGSARPTGCVRPSAHDAARRAVGGRHERRLRFGAGEAARPRTTSRPRRTRSGPRRRGSPPHRAASAARRPTQCTSRATPAPQTTSGSSALATTWVCGAAASAARQRPATIRTSLVRSSWSRDRLSRTTTTAPRRGEHPREVDLVHLQDGAVGVRPGQRGDVTRWHVRPGLVAHDRVARGGERHRQQPRRRGLAVGPGDQSHLAPGAQVLEQLRIEPQPGPSAGHRSLAAARAAATRR